MSTQSNIQLVAQKAKDAKLTLAEAKAHAAGMNMSLNELLSAVSVFVAKQYESKALHFAEADTTMNSLWAILFEQPASEIRIPEVLQDVFDAFDQGEYYHAGDDKGIDPEEKYPIPMLKAALEKYRNDA